MFKLALIQEQTRLKTKLCRRKPGNRCADNETNQLNKLVKFFLMGTRPFIRLLQSIGTGTAGAVHETAAPVAGFLLPMAVEAEKILIIQYETNLIVTFPSPFQDETKAVRDVPVLFRSAPDCGAFFIFGHPFRESVIVSARRRLF